MECTVKLFLLVFILSSFGVQAEVKVIEKYKFYTVEPHTVSSLLTSLNTRSPIQEKGNIFHGKTEYKLDSRFGWVFKSNQCHLVKVNTTLKLTYTMPKLVTSQKRVSKIWSKWYPNLYAHEKEHGRLAIKIADEADNKILSLRAEPDCKTLQLQAQTIVKKSMIKLKRAYREYDLRTNHGETQGAWLYAYL